MHLCIYVIYLHKYYVTSTELMMTAKDLGTYLLSY